MAIVYSAALAGGWITNRFPGNRRSEMFGRLFFVGAWVSAVSAAHVTIRQRLGDCIRLVYAFSRCTQMLRDIARDDPSRGKFRRGQ